MTNQPDATATITIRRAGPEDAHDVRTLLLELATHENSADAVHASLADWRRMLADPSVVVLLAVAAEQPLGYVSGTRQLNLWQGHDIFAMDDLYVRPQVRDRGIGGMLMAALAEHVRPDKSLITWGVNQDNDAGQRFYQRLGATLRTKMVAAWRPDAYTRYLQDRA
ncbi:GNAT family N-acetyltransferase [Nocardioides sp. GCM10028917]|uniref:GNAT family N-acetyltransferase n=1 Tax=Nocardioides sp. GCM10028917 TaxID=3273408 RepID=UPI00360DEC85